MKIELTHIKVRDLVDEFSDSDENGVTGYHGLLDIRPQYQHQRKNTQHDFFIFVNWA